MVIGEITPDGQPGDWGQVVIKIANHPPTSGGIKEFVVVGDGEVGPVRDGLGTMQGTVGRKDWLQFFVQLAVQPATGGRGSRHGRLAADDQLSIGPTATRGRDDQVAEKVKTHQAIDCHQALGRRLIFQRVLGAATGVIVKEVEAVRLLAKCALVDGKGG